MKSTIQKSIAKALNPEYKMWIWKDGKLVANPLTEEAWQKAIASEETVEDAQDLLSDIVAFTIEVAGVDAVLAKMPEDWELSSDFADSPTKYNLAYGWLWEQLTHIEEVQQ